MNYMVEWQVQYSIWEVHIIYVHVSIKWVMCGSRWKVLNLQSAVTQLLLEMISTNRDNKVHCENSRCFKITCTWKVKFQLMYWHTNVTLLYVFIFSQLLIYSSLVAWYEELWLIRGKARTESWETTHVHEYCSMLVGVWILVVQLVAECFKISILHNLPIGIEYYV